MTCSAHRSTETRFTATSPSLHNSVVGTGTLSWRSRWWVKGIARYQFSAPGSAPYVDDLAAEPVDVLAGHAAVAQPLVEAAAGLRRPAAPGSRGVWKAPMYQDENAWRLEKHRPAERRGVRHRDRGPGAHQLGSVRRDQPAGVGAPVVADEVHRPADGLDQRDDVAPRACPSCSRGAAAAGRRASSRAGRARRSAAPARAAAAPPRASRCCARGSRAAARPGRRRAAPRRGRRR